MICLDTHTLLWWALEPEKLSKKASEICATMEREGGYASAISLWEIGWKIRQGKLAIGMKMEDFAQTIRSTDVLDFVPVDADIWLASLRLDWNHRDPADRAIVATAQHLDVPLLTKDDLLHAFPGARAIW